MESEREETWHRALYILDEIKTEVKIKKVIKDPQWNYTQSQMQQNLTKIVAKSKMVEVRTMTESLITELFA